MVSQYNRIGDPEDIIAALATPLAGHTSSEILEHLRHHNVQESSLLTADVVSTRAPRRVLQALERIARIEPKTTRSMHPK